MQLTAFSRECFAIRGILPKTLRVMQLTTVLLLGLCLQTTATGLSQTITFSGKEVPLEKVFSTIKQQTGYFISYKASQIRKAKPVTIQGQNMPIELFLNEVLKDQPLEFTIEASTIFIKWKNELFPRSTVQPLPNNLLPPSDITLSGQVTNAKKESLEGVSVTVKGTQTGTTTDADGRFRLSVPSANNVELVFSFVGYETQTVKAGSKAVFNIIMEEVVSNLSDIVVVGYGTQKKVNLTGAVTMVKFDNEMSNRPITNATQALSGKATGVWVSQNSGKPGSDGAQLRVRGWGTMNNSNPLVIIDGVEGSFDQINPNDIESISVLKDAASSAIYGSKAANGVILVSSKMGRKNEKMQVKLNSYYGIQSLGRRYEFLNNSAQYMKIYNQALANNGASPLFPDYLIEDFEKGDDPYKYPNTDWNKALFKKAPIQEYNVSLMGGSVQTSSFLSFNYLNQEGIVPNTKSGRYGIRANLESNINSWLKLTGRINFSRKISDEPYSDITYGSLGRVFYMLNGTTPFIAPYTRDGRFGSVQAIDASGNLLYDNRNPLIDAANGLTRTEMNAVIANATAEIKFTKDLKWNTTFASTGNWSMVDRYNQSLFGYTDGGVETITKNYNREGLEMNRSNVSSINNNLYSTLNYTKTFADIHDFSAIAGMQFENTTIKNVYARSAGAPKEGLTQVDAGTTGIQGQGNMVGIKMLSYFGRINYTLLNKYLFEADIRADASSRFKEGNRWGVFPGFSAGWKLSEEKFIQNLDVFSNLKLRASWGQLGNQNISGYWPYLTVITQNYNSSYSYGGSLAPGAAVTALIDENITWETTATLDFGLDMGFLNNRLSVDVDYFKKNTSGIIVQLPIPLVMGGVTPPFENVGQMLNEGIEIALNYDSRKAGNNTFSYRLGANLTYINNEVTKFRGGKSPDQLYLIREGYSYNTLYGYKAIGIFQTDDEAAKYMAQNSYKPKAGNLKFEDVNQDGRLDFQDKQSLGNTIPKFTYGLTAGFNYKGFDLNILLQGIGGVHAYTQNDVTNMTTDVPSITKKWENAWTPQNTNTDIPAIRLDNTWDNAQSSFWVKQIGFVKMRNIQLGYNIPANISSRLRLQTLYVYANAQNVFTIVNRKYEGYDPERNTFDAGDRLYPNPRIISFGINVKF